MQSVSHIAGNVVTGVIALCAVGMTGVTLRHELYHPAGTGGRHENTRVADFASYVAVGHRIGPDAAPVKILEFGDFECPVCGEFARHTLQGVRARYGDKVQLIFRNWPLSYHRLAYPAARAAECAAAQGKFAAYFDALYSKQDSLGLKTFESFAREANVPNIAVFDQCDSITGTVPAVEADIRAAKAIGGQGTPTIVINGMMIANTLDSTAVDSMVRAAITAAR